MSRMVDLLRCLCMHAWMESDEGIQIQSIYDDLHEMQGRFRTGQDYGCPKVRLEVLLKTLTRHPSFWDIPGMFEAWDIHQTFLENNQRMSHKGKERYRGVIPRVSNLDIHRTFHLSGGVAYL